MADAKPGRPAARKPSPTGDWRDGLIRSNSTWQPKPLLTNAGLALRQASEWTDRLAFDTFAQQITLCGAAPWELNGVPPKRPWSDYFTALTCEWLQQQDIHVTPETAGLAVATVAQGQKFHPVHDYLRKCTWDGLHRLDSMLSAYFGAEQSPYTAAVGARWLISAVARVYDPGCKADHAPIFEGKQGTRKSTAVSVLFSPWFAEDLGGDIGSKDAALQIAGRWCIELAELDSLERSEVSRIKAWISRRTDRYRPPYGKLPIDQPRQCVFAGTVNRDDYLRDETGGRRFWPIRCATIDVEGLARDRDQLWAEAAVRYHAGESWWLDQPDLSDQAEVEQGQRYSVDAWDQVISTYISEHFKEEVTVQEVLRHAVGIDVGKWSRTDQMRVAKSLVSMGWAKVRLRDGDVRIWAYRMPVLKAK